MHQRKLWLTALTLGSIASVAPTASADFKACGNVFLKADANCEYREKESCKTTCTTEAVQTSCVAKVYTSCESGCTLTASAECESGCTETCTESCTTPAQPLTCEELCLQDCNGKCADGGGPGSCCGHGCSWRCEERCKDAPPPTVEPAECMTTCTNACSGSCTAEANLECQTTCQDSTITECETELVEKCETECEDEGGAIFCDGQFINSTSAQSCADELKDKLDIRLEIKGALNDTTDRTKKKVKDACSVGNVGEGNGGLGALLGLGVLGGALTLRSRKRRNR